MNTDKAVTEAELKQRSVAPRITEELFNANIASIHYFTAADGRRGAIDAGAYSAIERPTEGNADLTPLGLLTFCVIVLKNGFTVTGESACASPENYQQDIGERIALANAKQKIWPLMGYALRDHLAYDGQSMWAQPAEKHDFWRPGEADCPRDIKAPNGELHTLRCRKCGAENPRGKHCGEG